MENIEPKIVVEVEKIGENVREIKRFLPENAGFSAPDNGGYTDPSKVATQLPFDKYDPNTLPYQMWGDSTQNNFPTTVRQKIESVPLAVRALQRLSEMICGEGIGYALNADIAKGEINPYFSQEIDDFLFENAADTEYLPNQSLEYLMFANAFSEAEINSFSGKIVGLYHKTAEYCRLAQQSKFTNRIEYLLFSPEFQHDRTLTYNDAYIPFPLYQSDNYRGFFDKLRGTRFAFHTRQNAVGVSYYARLLWYELMKKESWFEVARNAPRLALKMMLNQSILKYQIIIPLSYFQIRHPEWDSYSAEKRKEVIDAKIKEINTYLSGIDNAYKSFAYVCEEDEMTHEKYGKIEIIAIDDKVKTGTWIPDASVANLEILNSLGINPNQFQLANQQGKSMGAGSGSDSRVGYDIQILSNTTDQKKLLYPLNVISKKNGWGVTFYVKHKEIVPLNENKNGINNPQKPENNG